MTNRRYRRRTEDRSEERLLTDRIPGVYGSCENAMMLILLMWQIGKRKTDLIKSSM